MDVASNKTSSKRKKFNIMLKDIDSKSVDIIIKSVSRFGQGTADVLEDLNVIKNAEDRIIFEQE